MLGIIGAMDIEIDLITSKLKNAAVTNVAGLNFWTGHIENVIITVVRCSPGKVNAALCTQAMLDHFDIDCIINIGVGCSLNEHVIIKNIVIATHVCQYDIDITALGEPKGYINGLDIIHIPTDKTLSEKIARVAINSGEKIHRGRVASGDTFIAGNSMKKEIAENFDALCGEMEGGAIGHVCYANNIPFAVVRSISDGGDENAMMDYPTFKKIAADISGAILTDYIITEQNQTTLF